MLQVLQHKVPKDIDLIVYRFAHRDLMKLVNQEYHTRLRICGNCDKVCTHFIQVIFTQNTNWGYNVFNYRDIYQYKTRGMRIIYHKNNGACSTLHHNY